MNPYGPLTLVWICSALLLPGHFLLRRLGATDTRGPLSPADDRLSWIGWCAATGAVFNCLLMYVWLWALPGTMSALSLAAVQVLLTLALWFAGRRASSIGQPRAQVASRFTRASRGERGVFWAALLLAMALAVTRVLDSNQAAALSGDGALIWGFKARVIHDTGGLGEQYVEAMRDPRIRQANYPLFNPLLQMWVLQAKGAATFVAQRLPIQILSAALLLVLAGALRRVARPALAAALLTIFAVSPLTGHTLRFVYADAMVAFGLLLMVDAWLRWREDGRSAFLGLMAIGVTLMIGSKTEATIYMVAFVASLALLFLAGRFNGKERGALQLRPRALAGFLIPASVFIAGKVFNANAGFLNDLGSGKGSGVGFFPHLAEQWQDYMGTVWTYFVDRAWTTPRFDGLIFVCLGIATVLSIGSLYRGARETRDLIVPIGISASLWAGLFLIYLATPQPLVWHLEASVLRVTWQALPIAAIGLAGLLDAALSPRSNTSP